MAGGSSSRKQDTLDRLVIFLAKRDGIDKVVKTFQYVAKLAHWRLQEGGHTGLAERAKKWEVSCGTSRKAFRTGRFLSGLNALRAISGGRPPAAASNLGMQLLSIFSNGGEMVYFFFDHLLWLARIGLLDPHLASRMSFVSAFGEAFGYIFFIISDLILISHGLHTEKQLLHKLAHLSTQENTAEKERDHGLDGLIKERDHGLDGLIKESRANLRAIRMQRVMQILAIAANLADLIIALAEIEPNPFCNHAITLGISGLVSAWSGWYRNWPSST